MPKFLRSYWPYMLVMLAVLAPLFLPGYILTLDLVFTPHIPMPQMLSSSYLFHAALHGLNLFIPSQIIEKLLLAGILLLSSVGMHRLLIYMNSTQHRVEPPWGVYVASIFFAVNPYTYSRFMAGQTSVLLGYALLPWFVRLLFRAAQQRTDGAALRLGALAAVIAIVSIHTLGEIVVLVFMGIGVTLCTRSGGHKSYIRPALVATVCFVLLSVYWLVPLAIGRGGTARAIDQFSSSDTTAFATTGGSLIGRLGNVVRLQGFWAEGHNLYMLPQDATPLWGLLMLLLIGLVLVGWRALGKRHPTRAIFFMLIALLGALLAVGTLTPLTSRLPIVAGLREPQKLAGLVAFGYSVLLSYGVTTLARRTVRRQPLYIAVVVGALLLPVLLARVMFWGFMGQLTPRQYPASWLAADHYLRQDKGQYAVLFLPWHEYMTYRFAGRIIASPAPQFFTRPTLASTNPELGGAVGLGQDATHNALDQLLGRQSQTQFGQQLARFNIKYILLDHDLDYRSYSWLTHQPGLRLTRHSPDLDVYVNTDWRSP
ncbi:MAG TPA: hypothetical protein VLF91_01250 [Candidatus Saccharimonadales bacterium]|nr:hypothetical protein [Candidatus Saccharimonadales bacterium]